MSTADARGRRPCTVEDLCPRRAHSCAVCPANPAARRAQLPILYAEQQRAATANNEVQQRRLRPGVLPWHQRVTRPRGRGGIGAVAAGNTNALRAKLRKPYAILSQLRPCSPCWRNRHHPTAAAGLSLGAPTAHPRVLVGIRPRAAHVAPGGAQGETLVWRPSAAAPC